MSLDRWDLLPVCALVFVQCGGHEPLRYDIVCAPRDFEAHPAIQQLEGADELFALSDVHGGYQRMAALLARHGLIAGVPATPRDAVWRGGSATFAVVGDVIDKGPQGIEALDMLMALEPQAEAAGGRLTVLIGNHEAEFLADPSNDKATAHDGVVSELERLGILPVALASGADPRGVWLRDRALAVQVGSWFFAHAGDTRGRSAAALETAVEQGLEAHDYRDTELVGEGSLLEARDWWGSDAARARSNASALHTKHIVFGHEPHALGATGQIAMGFDGLLFRIDCGMSPDIDDSEGCLLHVRRDGADDVAEALDAHGRTVPLWRGAH